MPTKNEINEPVLVRPSISKRGLALRSYRLSPGNQNAFAVSGEALFEAWLTVAERQPRTRRIAADSSMKCALHVQHTPLLRFPDDICAEVIDLGSGKTGILVDSRSRFGLTDFGVNRRRVMAWFAELRALIDR